MKVLDQLNIALAVRKDATAIDALVAEMTSATGHATTDKMTAIMGLTHRMRETVDPLLEPIKCECDRFEVVEHMNGFEILDRNTGNTHWLSDGVDCVSDPDSEEDFDALPPGGEAFCLLWAAQFNGDEAQTLEAYWPEQYEKEYTAPEVTVKQEFEVVPDVDPNLARHIDARNKAYEEPIKVETWDPADPLPKLPDNPLAKGVAEALKHPEQFNVQGTQTGRYDSSKPNEANTGKSRDDLKNANFKEAYQPGSPPPTYHAEEVKAAIGEMESLMKDLSQFGASDTEPDYVWQRLLMYVVQGEPYDVPEDGSGWQLFSDMEGCDDAAQRLSDKADEVLTMVANVTLGEKDNLYGFITEHCWRIS